MADFTERSFKFSTFFIVTGLMIVGSYVISILLNIFLFHKGFEPFSSNTLTIAFIIFGVGYLFYIVSLTAKDNDG